MRANTSGFALIEKGSGNDATFENEVKIEGTSNAASNVLVIGSAQVTGRATLLGHSPDNWKVRKETPTARSQVGFWQGRVAGQHDSARRVSGFVPVRYKNRIVASIDDWTFSPAIDRSLRENQTDNRKVTTEHPAPDGTRGAVRVPVVLPATGNSSQRTDPFRENALDVCPGDYVVMAVWVRRISGPPSKLGGDPVTYGFADTRILFAQPGIRGPRTAVPGDPRRNRSAIAMPLAGDGEWQWLSRAEIIEVVPPQPLGRPMHATFRFSLMSYWNAVDNHTDYEFYAPMLLHIGAGNPEADPSEHIERNELFEFVQHLSPWSGSATRGTLASMPGQAVLMQDDCTVQRDCHVVGNLRLDQHLTSEGARPTMQPAMPGVSAPSQVVQY